MRTGASPCLRSEVEEYADRRGRQLFPAGLVDPIYYGKAVVQTKVARNRTRCSPKACAGQRAAVEAATHGARRSSTFDTNSSRGGLSDTTVLSTRRRFAPSPSAGIEECASARQPSRCKLFVGRRPIKQFDPVALRGRGQEARRGRCAAQGQGRSFARRRAGDRRPGHRPDGSRCRPFEAPARRAAPTRAWSGR